MPSQMREVAAPYPVQSTSQAAEVMGAVRVLVTLSSSPTAIVPEASALKFHPKKISCFQEAIADHPRAFPVLEAAPKSGLAPKTDFESALNNTGAHPTARSHTLPVVVACQTDTAPSRAAGHAKHSPIACRGMHSSPVRECAEQISARATKRVHMHQNFLPLLYNNHA